MGPGVIVIADTFASLELLCTRLLNTPPPELGPPSSTGRISRIAASRSRVEFPCVSTASSSRPASSATLWMRASGLRSKQRATTSATRVGTSLVSSSRRGGGPVMSSPQNRASVVSW